MSTRPTAAAPSRALTTAAQRYLIFAVANDHYALPVLKVSEIIQIQSITRIAKLPPYVKGVINLRGKVIPVIDLRLKFEFAEAHYEDRTCIIVVFIKGEDGRESSTGLIVDGVEEVARIADGDIVEAHNFGHSFLAADYIFGVVQMGERIATILDVDRVVNDRTLKKITEASRKLAEEASADDSAPTARA